MARGRLGGPGTGGTLLGGLAGSLRRNHGRRLPRHARWAGHLLRAHDSRAVGFVVALPGEALRSGSSWLGAAGEDRGFPPRAICPGSALPRWDDLPANRGRDRILG